MKKTIALSFIAMFGLAVITATSCSKKGDYICECTYMGVAAGTPSTQMTISNTTKSKAKDACKDTQDSINEQSQAAGVTGDVVSCEIK